MSLTFKIIVIMRVRMKNDFAKQNSFSYHLHIVTINMLIYILLDFIYLYL